MISRHAGVQPLGPRGLTASIKPPQTGDLVALLRVLGDNTRLRIFALLTKVELCVCEIEDILGLSQSLVSNHLRVLRKAGLVRARRDEEDARWVFYRADPVAVSALRERLRALLDVQAAPGDRRRAEQVCRIRSR
jgi:DNA-binding transcriptional ArsR family regulator